MNLPARGAAFEMVPGSRQVADRGAWVEDARLRALLAHAAGGDVGAFMEFYDATCDMVWRLEVRRWRSRTKAEAAATRRFSVAWSRSGQQAESGLSARAWLLSLPCISLCPER